MKKEIVKDPFFLSQKAIPANPTADKQVIIDLQDTLRANRDRWCRISGEYDWKS